MNKSRLAAVSLFIPAIALTYDKPNNDTGRSYILEPARLGAIANSVEATGTVEAVATVEVGSEVSGLIDKVFVNFNDSVTAGHPIAELDRAAFEARVNEGRAALKVATALVQVQQSALKRADVGVANAKAAKRLAEAQAAAAKARGDQSEEELKRKLLLSRSGATTERELSQARTLRDTGQAELRAAQEQVEMQANAIEIAEADARMAAANVDNAESAVEEKQAVLDEAEVELRRTVIRAPIDGVVISREVNPGQAVAVGLETKTLFRIAHDLSEMQVRGSIDEADIGLVKDGQEARFTVDAYPNRVFEGHVVQVRKAPEVTQNVVTYAAIVSAPNPERLLYPGMTAQLRITTQETGDVLTVPNRALDFRPPDLGESHVATDERSRSPAENARVWVEGPDGRAIPVEIGTGLRDDARTEVTAGPLRQGEPVIIGVAKQTGQRHFLALKLDF
jgi:HlyD family secretion protein